MDIKTTIRNFVSIPNRLYNTIILKYRGVKVGRNLEINGRIYCVSNCKDAIEIGNNVKINSWLWGADPIVLFVGRVTYGKGIDLLFKALGVAR